MNALVRFAIIIGIKMISGGIGKNELSEKDWKRICGYLRQILAPVILHHLDLELFRDLILHDKKAQKQAVNFIMLKKLGESFIQQEMPVEKLWDEFNKFTALHPEFVELR